jgi:predicted nuclease with TOPRIM domain
MDKQEGQLNAIIGKVNKLIVQHNQVKSERQQLAGEVNNLRTQNQGLQDKIRGLEEQVDFLTKAKQLSGQEVASESESKITRKKLNKYIREIDKAIALMSAEDQADHETDEQITPNPLG